mgnify:CR=1 FL=1
MGAYLDSVPLSGIIRIRDMMYTVDQPFRLDQGDVSFDAAKPADAKAAPATAARALQLVWFKRDLRVRDHAPLVAAAARGAVLPLYVVEPSLWAAPDADRLHWQFVAAALHELQGLCAFYKVLGSYPVSE